MYPSGLVDIGALDKAATGAPRRMTEAIPALKPEIDVPDAYDKVEKLLRAPAPLSSPRSAVLHLSLPGAPICAASRRSCPTSSPPSRSPPPGSRTLLCVQGPSARPAP